MRKLKRAAGDESPNDRPWGTGRAAFLAHRAAIAADVESGVSLVAVYAQHKGHLGISYAQFTRYVARFIPDALASRRGTRLRPSTATTPIGSGTNDRASAGVDRTIQSVPVSSLTPTPSLALLTDAPRPKQPHTGPLDPARDRKERTFIHPSDPLPADELF